MFVLEAVGSGTAEGTVVSIGKPAGTPNQKWVMTAKGNNLYAIKPSYSSTLVLAAAMGGTKIGTAIVLETEQRQALAGMEPEEERQRVVLLDSPARSGKRPGPSGRQTGRWSADRLVDQQRRRSAPGVDRQAAGGHDTGGLGRRGRVSTQHRCRAGDQTRRHQEGRLKSFTYSRSTIFPGTVRQVTLFIPAQYDASKPACVYVKTDGFNPREQFLLETMIATGEMPVTIGVFVQPGNLPATVKGTIGRRNRCFEYDGVGDNNVRFLVDELLPFVAEAYHLKMSTRGNDRCIAGVSSGGIAAFNAAWERPDAFSRVYANSGNFVAFRGGHEFPTLVRKFEAKPIRAYLDHRHARHGELRRRLVLARSGDGQGTQVFRLRLCVPNHQRWARRGVPRLLAGSDELSLERLAPGGQSRTECSEGGAISSCPMSPGSWSPTIARMPADQQRLRAARSSSKTQVDSGLKLATGLAYRPDQWLLSVADGGSKWAYSYQINADGTLSNKERFFRFHVPDGEDDAGAESVCYAREGPMLVATRLGIQVCADDGPTQVILPTPDRVRVVGVCLGGRAMDTLFAFGGARIWKRKVKVHGLGAFSPWTAGARFKLVIEE